MVHAELFWIYFAVIVNLKTPLLDLEDFFNDIKRRKIKNKTLIWQHQQYSFHLSLLTRHEKKMLEREDENYLSSFRRIYNTRKKAFESPDVPKEEMEASESNQKYVLSTCSRSTFALAVDLMPHEVPKDSTEDIDESSDESLSEVLQAGYDWVFS